MKLGPLEIIVILIIAGAILLAFRGMPSRKLAAPPLPPPPPARVRRPTAAEAEEESIKASRQKRMRVLGGVFVVIGIVLLAYTFKALDIIFMMSTGAGLIIILGIVILLLSVRR
jgi:hypothetical protein